MIQSIEYPFPRCGKFADYIASQDELLYMNSHTQEEMIRLQSEGEEDVSKKVDMKPLEKQLSASVEFLTQVQDGKVTISDEAQRSLRTVIKELCSTVSDWAQEET